MKRADIERLWYGDAGGARLLAPLACLYGAAAVLRRSAYRRGTLRVEHLPVPVIVVGNITVGGTGKTPLVIAIVERLRSLGWRPGIVSRGYGGARSGSPLRVQPETPPRTAGDEPVLLARRLGCPVAVCPDRAAAGQLLCRDGDVDVLVADDGLQHYRLARELEIAVVDGVRRFGNGRLLPAGPLREPPSRLREVDLVVVNGGQPRGDEMGMRLAGDVAERVIDGTRRPLQAFRGQKVHAVAGIGNPSRFFDHLERHGLTVERHAFADHHAFQPDDLRFGDDRAILMTEKDAVKCAGMADHRHWFVPVDAVFDAAGDKRLASLLGRIARHAVV